MESYPYERPIHVSQLLVDIRNPRLPKIAEHQIETIRSMTTTQGNKIVSLAEHLVRFGPNPANLPIVMPSETDEGMFHVLDGNRRITAVKLLENPSIVSDILSNNSYRRLRDLSEEFKQSPINRINCIVFQNRESADTWIQLIHRGENQGAGLVSWDGQVAARYDSYRQGSKSFALNVLDWVADNADLSDPTAQRIENGKFPITNLERLVNTPFVRKKLGIEHEAGKLVFQYPEDEVLKGLLRIVEDLGNKRITVSDIKKQAQRIDYITKFDDSELPDPKSRNSDSDTTDSSSDNKSKKKPGKRKRTTDRSRSALIPRSCKLVIEPHRIDRIYSELKRLNLDDFPNAGAVMFRVFLELSLDYYLENTVKWAGNKIDGSTLAQKLTAAANSIETEGLMTQQQIAAIRKAAGGQTLFAASVRSMHGWVHNKHYSPIATELKTTWDDFQDFFEVLWSPQMST